MYQKHIPGTKMLKITCLKMNEEIKKQPKTLLNSAAKVVGMNIAHQALEVLKKWCTQPETNVEVIRDLELLVVKAEEFFDINIPRILHDIITNESLEYLASRFKWVFEVIHDDFWGFTSTMLEHPGFDTYESAICSALRNAILRERLKYVHISFNFLSVCLRSHLSKLNFYDWPDIMHDAILKNLTRLKNLKYLNLTSSGLYRNSTSVNRAIKEMKCLESFKCLGCPTDTLEFVCDNCPLIRLNIWFSDNINDSSLPSILKLQNLQKLNISVTFFTETSITKILRGLPNLISIHTSQLQLSLAQIGDTNEKFPLQHVRYCDPNQEDFMNLTKHCPFTTKLYISGDGSMDFTSLAALKHLKKLRLNFQNLLFKDIKSLLQLIGHQITKLDIDRLDDSSTTAMNEIKSLCPNLEEFVFNGKEM